MVATKDGLPQRFLIEGTNFSTDEKGNQEIQELKAKYVGKASMRDRPKLSKEIQDLYARLRHEGRLWWRDGTVLT